MRLALPKLPFFGLRRALFCAFGVVGVQAALAAPSYATFPGTNGRISFGANPAGNFEVYSVLPDGTGMTDLTNFPASDDGQPAYSADGQKIVFQSDRNHGTLDREVFTMNADGSNQVDVSNNAAFDSDPSWSPDGTKIVFISNRDGTNAVWVMNADGSNQHPLSSAAWDLTCWSGFPRWSPDGTKIAFQQEYQCSGHSSDHDILVASADGSGTPVDITASSRDDDIRPDWSPDGSQIVYASNGNVFVTKADGSGTTTQITTSGGYDAKWSPDGGQIVYDLANGVYTIPATGGTPHPVYVPGGAVSENSPDWQPIPPVAPAPTGQSGSGGPTGASAASVKVKGTALAMKITCQGPAGSACDILDRLTTTEHLRGTKIISLSSRLRARKKSVTVGNGHVAVAAGQTATISLTLNAKGKGLLKKFHTLPARLSVTLTNGPIGHAAKIGGKTVTFKQGKRRRH